MRLLGRIRSPRVLAVVFCVFAMPIFSFPTTSTEAYVESECVCRFAGLAYSDGACLNNQTCVCNYPETGPCVCKWIASNCDGLSK